MNVQCPPQAQARAVLAVDWMGYTTTSSLLLTMAQHHFIPLINDYGTVLVGVPIGCAVYAPKNSEEDDLRTEQHIFGRFVECITIFGGSSSVFLNDPSRFTNDFSLRSLLIGDFCILSNFDSSRS